MSDYWWLAILAFVVLFVIGFILALNTAGGRKRIGEFAVAFASTLFTLAARLAEALIDMVIKRLEPPAQGLVVSDTVRLRNKIRAARESVQ